MHLTIQNDYGVPNTTSKGCASGPKACTITTLSIHFPLEFRVCSLCLKSARHYFLPSSKLFRETPSWASVVSDFHFLPLCRSRDTPYTLRVLWYLCLQIHKHNVNISSRYHSIKEGLLKYPCSRTTFLLQESLLHSLHSFIHQIFKLMAQKNNSGDKQWTYRPQSHPEQLSFAWQRQDSRFQEKLGKDWVPTLCPRGHFRTGPLGFSPPSLSIP